MLVLLSVLLKSESLIFLVEGALLLFFRDVLKRNVSASLWLVPLLLSLRVGVVASAGAVELVGVVGKGVLEFGVEMGEATLFVREEELRGFTRGLSYTSSGSFSLSDFVSDLVSDLTSFA